jgi:hypothetical protein
VASEPSDVEEGSLDDDRQSIMSESSIFVVLEGGRGMERAASEVSQEKRQLIVALESRLHGALHFGDDAVTHALRARVPTIALCVRAFQQSRSLTPDPHL